MKKSSVHSKSHLKIRAGLRKVKGTGNGNGMSRNPKHKIVEGK
jgi:hypothetical protein